MFMFYFHHLLGNQTTVDAAFVVCARVIIVVED